MKTSIPDRAAPAADSQDAANDAYLTACGKAAGRPRAADKEARLHNLLQTATCLFLQKGYSKVSLEMIAREAHVAVRTIYVKFGGKAGLLNAVIAEGRARFFAGMDDMSTDTRSMEAILTDFSVRFLELVSLPSFITLHRMVLAEATTTPELAMTFYQAGPQQTREQLTRFFSRPDIAARLRDDVPQEVLITLLLNCLLGNQMTRMLFEPDHPSTAEEIRAKVEQGLLLFFGGALRR